MVDFTLLHTKFLPCWGLLLYSDEVTEEVT